MFYLFFNGLFFVFVLMGCFFFDEMSLTLYEAMVSIKNEGEP